MTSCCQSSPRPFSTESASKQTGCSTSKLVQGIAGQPFPGRGVLVENLDTPLAVLRRTIPTPLQEFPVFAYIVKTVKFTGRQFVQLGSGPNFQGDCITLCTCKHKDRASPPKDGCRGTTNPDDPWEGAWVAGLCSPSQVRPRGLFYLMLVERTFESHAACWYGLNQPSAKSAHRDPYGDIYEPLPGAETAPWSAVSYMAHLPGHRHDPSGREKDIEVSYHGRHPRLLVGEPKRSYLWTAPHITLIPAVDDDWTTAHHRFLPQLRGFLGDLT